MTMSARRAAQAQWTAVPAGTHLTDANEGSPAFFAQMTRSRYRLQPWHPDLLRTFAPTGRLLEIGCGAGTDHAHLADMARTTVGIDLAERGARLTHRRLRLEDRPGATMVADGEALPFASGSFDEVYSFGVIHHTDTPELVAGEMQRVLRPGGRFLVALYHRDSLWTVQKAAQYLATGAPRRIPWRRWFADAVEFGAHAQEAPPRIRLYSRRTSRRLFEGAGFTDVAVRTEHPWCAGRIVPGPLARPFGWYVVVTGSRP